MGSPVSADWSRTATPSATAAIDRDHVAFADHQPVARLDRLQVDLFELAVSVPDGAARDAGEQRGHLAAGATLGKAFEILPAGIHQGDHGGGEVFGKNQGRQHRKRGDDIQADIAAAQADDDLGQEDDEDRDRGHGPYRGGPMLPSRKLGCESDDKARRRPYNEQVGETSEFRQGPRSLRRAGQCRIISLRYGAWIDLR